MARSYRPVRLRRSYPLKHAARRQARKNSGWLGGEGERKEEGGCGGACPRLDPNPEPNCRERGGERERPADPHCCSARPHQFSRGWHRHVLMSTLCPQAWLGFLRSHCQSGTVCPRKGTAAPLVPRTNAKVASDAPRVEHRHDKCAQNHRIPDQSSVFDYTGGANIALRHDHIASLPAIIDRNSMFFAQEIAHVQCPRHRASMGMTMFFDLSV